MPMTRRRALDMRSAKRSASAFDNHHTSRNARPDRGPTHSCPLQKPPLVAIAARAYSRDIGSGSGRDQIGYGSSAHESKRGNNRAIGLPPPPCLSLLRSAMAASTVPHSCLAPRYRRRSACGDLSGSSGCRIDSSGTSLPVASVSEVWRE